MKQLLPDNHYCGECYYYHNYSRGRCETCDYTPNSGFSNWVPMSFNGTTMNDLINSPKHYMLFPDQGIEVRHVLEALVNKIDNPPSKMFVSDYVQMMQYGMRFMEKGGQQDLRKMKWFLNRCIDAFDQ